MENKLKGFISFLKDNKDMKIVKLFVQGNIFVYILIYVQTVLINTGLSPYDLGKFSYHQSLFMVIISVISLTIYSSHLRFLGFVDTNKLLNLIRKVLTIATFLFVVIVLVIWGEWRFIAFAGLMWFNEQLYYFRSLSRIKLYTAMKFIQHTIMICFIGVLLILKQANYETILLATGLTYIAAYALFYRKRKKCPIEKQVKEEFSTKDIFKYCAPAAGTVVSLYMLAAADQILINAYLLPSDLSDYAMAFRTLLIIQLFTSFFMDYWPRFYFENAPNRNYGYIKKMGFGFKTAITVFSVLCILLAVPIYYIMGAQAYVGQSVVIFSLLVFGEIFRVFGSINMTYRSFKKQAIYNLTILGGLGVIKLIIGYLFIEEYGITILLYTTVGSYITYWVLSYFLSVRAEKKFMLSNER